MYKKRVLFICIHNSARSQMAEAFLNTIGADLFEAESAGLEPGTLNPVVIEAMRDAGIDISHNTTKCVQEFIDAGNTYDYLITVCDEASAQRCPLFPGKGVRLHFDFPDPSAIEGTFNKKLEETKKIRDEIKTMIIELVKKEI